MDKTPLSDDNFIKKYEAYEKESIEDFIRKYSSTERELRETISYLIRHREMMRDVEIKKLESEAQSLLDRLKETNLKKLVEEIQCFKDIFSLHKRLIEENDKPRD